MRLVTEAYVAYTGRDNMTFNVPVSLLKKSINPQNFNKLNYIRYVANAFTYVMSLHVYFTDRNDYSNLTPTQIIVSDEQLADAIGCHPNTSTRVMNSLKEIFNLEYTRIHEQGGARIVTINQRVIEFLKIYSYDELFDYINKYDLREKKVFKAIQQLYRYRAWGVKAKYLRPSQQEARRTFLEKQKDFFHIASTNNMSDQSRIDLVKSNKDKISEYNVNQLDRIIQEKKHGKLSHYWFKLLVRLYQKVTKVIERIKRTKKQQENAAQNPSRIDNESIQGETVAHASATQKAQRIPEVPGITPNDYIEILVEWNNMLGCGIIPNVKALTRSEINAINTQVKSIGKRELISCIRKVQGLENVKNGKFKMTFKKFMTDKTINIIQDAGIQEDIVAEWFNDYMDETFGTVSVPYIKLSEVPKFNSISDAASWWNQQVSE